MQHDNDLMGAVSEYWQLRLQLELFLAPLITFQLLNKLSLLRCKSAFVGSLLHSGYSTLSMQDWRGTCLVSGNTVHHSEDTGHNRCEK